ncbi:LysR family transcriptional regulator [Rhodoferax sp. AJA081-3]|uniref:LysR family transcriptional regulator n=1 Tax=Rhodoferax sp. AJA081-3 TaxID=2752316 RepID=UPI001AE0A932|nr:LysR family transcriptional regulator [Rhodoferax sp. AJA081-3]QTN30197.1 LysR family transcriptional regulator [Rhodoferax sp. AJA081-3]
MDQLRALRVFAQVIAEGSFAGAARVMDLAPAVVTRAVSDLEDHLGVRLLNRTTRRLALTEVGEDYLERAKRVLAELDDADALAGAVNQAPSGTLSVLCPPAFASHQLVRHLPIFRQRFPGIHMELLAAGPVEVADENFDVSILSIGQQALQGDFVVRPLAASTFVLCASPAYLQRCGLPQQPEDLLQHDGLLPDVAAVRRELTLFREAHGATGSARRILKVSLRRPAISTAQLDVLYAAAMNGMGVAGLPTFMVADAVRDGRLVRVLPEWHGGALQLYAAMPTRKHVPARTRAFMDFLVETFGGNQDDPWLASLKP